MTVLSRDRMTTEELRSAARTMGSFPRSYQFALPLFPVPLRECFNNAVRNGRIDTPRYKLWKGQTDAALVRKKNLCGTPYKATLTGPVSVTFTARRPDRRKRDLDNLLKALNDTLSRNHIIEDDSKIVDLRIRWATDEVFEGEVFVEITQVAA